jgi:SAM-dependent methyltransferase
MASCSQDESAAIGEAGAAGCEVSVEECFLEVVQQSFPFRPGEEDLMTQLVFDDATARRIEAAYHAGDAVRRRALVREVLGASPGEHIADIGCGPGFYCSELAEEVGASGSVVGVDASVAMLELASRRCAALPNVALSQGEATSLPLPDASVDALVCAQVLEYVQDVASALSEMRRVLRPGSRVVIWDIDWDTVSWHSRDAARMRRMLETWDEHLTHRSLPRTLTAQLRAAGFEHVVAEAHAFTTIGFTTDGFGVMLLPIIEAFAAGRNEITQEEARAWAAEQHELGERGEFYFASTQFCFSARKPA